MLSRPRRCVPVFAQLLLLAAPFVCRAQTAAVFTTASLSSPPATFPATSSSEDSFSVASDGAEGAGGQAEPSTLLLRGRYGVEARIGASGFGFDVGKPLSPRVSVRLGGDFIRYSGTFTDQGADIDARLQFGYGKAELDFYPAYNGRFHISPLLIFANNTRIQANVLVDPAQTIDFGNDEYQSDPADPLRGVGRVELRHTAPGLAVGWGNITRGRSHFTFPVELGFFYVGQPKLTVDFRGTACDVSHPANGCGDITQDPDFQKDLARFIARNNHNLSYAQFIPIVNFGVGYRF